MYTELHFNAELKQDVPKEVIKILQYMIGDIITPVERPQHELFQTYRWDSMLVSDSYYFDADTHSTLRFDEIGKSHYLCIRCNVKNYDNEIEHFIDWIKPYLEKYKNEFLGFYRYEENSNPTLIFM